MNWDTKLERAPAVMTTVTVNPIGLQRFGDSGGSVTLGWVAAGVLYVRLDGGLSAKLGASYANQLEMLARRHALFELFVDSSGLSQYDLLARSAFIRAVQAHRRKFSGITVLTWREGLSSAAGRFAETLGGVELLTERSDFLRRLIHSAPRAQQVLAASTVQAKTSW